MPTTGTSTCADSPVNQWSSCLRNMPWEPYDPRWLVELAKAQHPDKPWLPEALSMCTTCLRKSDKYVRFVEATDANQPGTPWQFAENLWLDDPKEGKLILDILNGQRVGGVEYYNRLFTAG